MSAVFGFLGLDGKPADPKLLIHMGEALNHRAVDGRLTWVDGPAGMGHCMLHTTPSSAVERVLFGRNGYAITADARIDNRDQLISELGLDRILASELSDSQLILKAYLKWGKLSPAKLLGDYTFAIWDIDAQELFCARDHIGAKPFYYFYDRHNKFVFASEIKAIFCHSEVPKSLNEKKIADFLLADFENASATFYSHVFRLPPASALTVGGGTIRIDRFWSLDPDREIRLASDAEYAESFREVFTEAVRCRLSSAFPVGTMLSGGLDSSSIACVAHDILAAEPSRELHSFSIVFDKVKKSDERESISMVLASRPFRAHLVLGDSLAPTDDLDTVLWHQDEPFFAPNLFLNRQVWRVARESGVRVLLDGLLGDNVVSHGIEYLNELAQRWRWMRLARELGGLIEASRLDLPLHKPFLKYVRERGIRPFVPEVALGLLRKARRQPSKPWAEQLNVFNRDFVDRANIRGRLADRYRRERAPRTTRRAHADSLQCGMIETALETYNHACAEFGIETRFPFADKRVVEFCLAIPGSQKISQGYTRAIVRRAMAGYVPDAVRWRSDKGDLSWSFLSGFAQSASLVDSLIQSSKDFLHQFIDLSYVDRVLSRVRRGTVTEAEAELFHIAVLAAWHKGSTA